MFEASTSSSLPKGPAMKPVYVVYITFYRGNRLPPFYIGWSTETNILKGYNGSVKSKEYQSIWQQERANHPELFKTIILQRFETSFEALTREELLHRFFKVPYNPMLINKSIGRGKFGTVGPKSNEHKQKISISKKKNPTFGMLGRHHTEESIQKMRRPHTPEHIEKIRLSKKGKKRHDSRINKKKDPLYLKEYRRVYRLKRKLLKADVQST